MLDEAITNYLEECKNLTPKTQEWYTQKLAAFGQWCQERGIELEKVNNRTVVAYTDYLRSLPGRKAATLSSYTLAGYVQVIKGFVNWCANDDEYEELVSEKTARRIKKPRVDEIVIETFTTKQIQALYAAAEREYNPYLIERDKTILDILFNTGIRSGELCTLAVGNVFLSPDDPHIRVYGKGRKWREVGIPTHDTIPGTRRNTRRALQSFLHRYRQDASKTDLVFLSRSNQPMSVDGMVQLFDRLDTWAGGLEGVRCSAHTCRHTYAIESIRRGVSIYDLSTLLGHSSVKVTERYLRSEQAHEARKRQS